MDPFTTFPYTDHTEHLSYYEEDYIGWNESWRLLKPTQDSQVTKIVSLAIYSIMLLLGITGNGLVICLTGFGMKKTVTTIWYLNLAVADFLFTICLSSEIAYTALDRWVLGRMLCKLDSVVSFLNMFASVFFLTTISVDRCISVVHPVWALNHRTPQVASVMAAFNWAAAFVLSSPYFSFRVMEYLPGDLVQCRYNFISEDISDLTDWHPTMVMTEFVVGFLIPFVTILVCYGSIIIKLKGKIFGRFSRSFKVIVAVVLAFFCCWFPFHLFAILDVLKSDSPEMEEVLMTGTELSKGLVCLNSCLNPLLYAFLGTRYRKTNWQSFLSGLKGNFDERWAVSTFPSHRTSSTTSGMESGML
ncbi:chemerin-like receptor 1 [Hemicordylus capensis]|uniref:chemerin-like receptor 1 n=1 Tax=Hemicordylus capensis TaxID=884348 RepID=UPI00230247B9|nr:chemerin-like receptor 1 [Hemicordylus capensis]